MQPEDRHTFLVLRQLAAGIIHKTLRVNQPNTFPRLIDRQALDGEETHELRGNTNAGRPRAEEQNPMTAQRAPGRGR